MNGTILDTSIVIAYEKGKLDLKAWLASQSPDSTHVIAAITVSELLHGVERADNTTRARLRKAWIDAFVAAASVLDFDEDCARVHATLWAGLEKAGHRIGAHDMLIAATALRHDMRVATLNSKEFKRVPGLNILTP